MLSLDCVQIVFINYNQGGNASTCLQVRLFFVVFLPF